MNEVSPNSENAPPDICNKVPASIFKAYDIRGIVGKTLTNEIVYKIGQAIGSEARALNIKEIAVARDGRLSGPEFVKILSTGLQSTGINVIDIGMVPTPLLYFATYFLETGSGVMVTGSHNPPEYNGFKIVVAGTTFSGDDIQRLRSRIEKDNFERGEGTYRQQNIVSEYISRVKSDIEIKRSIKLIVDCGNGVAGAVAPKLLRSLGCEVRELFCDVDGHFPNHHPDPSQTKNLQDIINTLNESDAEIGLAFDGDGDRLGVVVSDGQIIWPDRQMVLYARDIISRNANAEIIYDVKCSRHLGNEIKKAGGKPLMWRTGHSLIKAKMKETGALLAGEMSGHIFFKERWYGFDDALYTAARLLEILSRTQLSPAEVFATVPDAVSTPELRIEFKEGEHFKFMEKFLSSTSFDEADITTIDGLRADFTDGWGLVRASNTTPSLILRFEADDENALIRIQESFRKALIAVDSTISLPF